MRIYALLAIMLVLGACNSSKNNQEKKQNLTTTIENTKTLEVYDFEGFQKFLNKEDDKTYVINFWATWCAPCVKELPAFEKINEIYKSQNVEVILVSLDFPNQYETKLKPFLTDKNIQSKVIALDDVDMNTWIPKVDDEWSGALPATVIYNKKERKFFEQSFTYEILETELKQFLK